MGSVAKDVNDRVSFLGVLGAHASFGKKKSFGLLLS